jgi:hypothetical protein
MLLRRTTSNGRARLRNRKLKPHLDYMEARCVLQGYNVTLDTPPEAGTSVAGIPQPYTNIADFQATGPTGNAITSSTGFKATIYWGDGMSSSGSIIDFPNVVGLFEVDGSHAYPNPSNGEYNIQVALTDPSGNVWYGASSTATVNPPTDQFNSNSGGGTQPSPTPPTQPSNNEFTSDDAFNLAYRFVRSAEGGVSNQKNDPGGLTKLGVTQSVYNNWLRSQGLKPRSVLKITASQTEAIFMQNYWNASGAPDLPPLLAIVQGDTAFNFGPGHGNSRKGTKGAGDFLDQTLRQAPPGATDLQMAGLYISNRIAFRYQYAKSHPTQRKFLKGWLNRDHNLLNYIDALSGFPYYVP